MFEPKADADGATDIEDLDRLMKEMENLEAENAVKDHPMEVGMVLGSRYENILLRLLINWFYYCGFDNRAHLAEKSIASREFYRTVLMKGFHFLVVILCTNQIQDTQCGFKLFTKHVASKLFGNLHLFRWAFDIELIYQAEACSIAMKEVSVGLNDHRSSCESYILYIYILYISFCRCPSIGGKLKVRNLLSQDLMLSQHH